MPNEQTSVYCPKCGKEPDPGNRGRMFCFFCPTFLGTEAAHARLTASIAEATERLAGLLDIDPSAHAAFWKALSERAAEPDIDKLGGAAHALALLKAAPKVAGPREDEHNGTLRRGTIVETTPTIGSNYIGFAYRHHGAADQKLREDRADARLRAEGWVLVDE